MTVITPEEARELNGWWAVLTIDRHQVISPIVCRIGPGDTANRIRAYQAFGWDPRFVPGYTCGNWRQLQRYAREAAKQARYGGLVLVAVPAALAAVLYGLPVTRYEREMTPGAGR